MFGIRRPGPPPVKFHAAIAASGGESADLSHFDRASVGERLEAGEASVFDEADFLTGEVGGLADFDDAPGGGDFEFDGEGLVPDRRDREAVGFEFGGVAVEA